MLKNIEWVGDAATGHLRLLDQTLLPERETYIDCRDVDCVWDAIKRLCVRGAPAMPIAGAPRTQSRLIAAHTQSTSRQPRYVSRSGSRG